MQSGFYSMGTKTHQVEERSNYISFCQFVSTKIEMRIISSCPRLFCIHGANLCFINEMKIIPSNPRRPYETANFYNERVQPLNKHLTPDSTHPASIHLHKTRHWLVHPQTRSTIYRHFAGFCSGFYSTLPTKNMDCFLQAVESGLPFLYNQGVGFFLNTFITHGNYVKKVSSIALVIKLQNTSDVFQLHCITSYHIELY
ncbi:hypothetical protein HELRODRAFT_173135 [Helobdella robusta]|uniref:Uncharacterized protein n=1 Tax=Helobdella robusta TaxID=6412 RepID=T1F6F5_HELRO|nr:hypothetical protein HELRODRAFT_173135 [Helobdella robusta]ESO04061.1 hypothetical protein HELRODRAFT_173135 [Helobdella robusta]